MSVEPKEYLFLAAALAAVAGALSAIAFAFLQAITANRGQLREQLESSLTDLRRRIHALNDHLRAQGTTLNVSDFVTSVEQFDTELLAALRDGISKINRELLTTFDRFKQTSVEILAQYLLEAAGGDRGDVNSLITHVRGQYRNEISELILRLCSLRLAIDRATQQEYALFQLAALSGVSVLMLCAAAIPPIQWELLHFVLFIGVLLIFAFYAILFVTTFIDRYESSTQGNERIRDFLSFIIYGFVSCSAYVALLIRAFE